MGVRRIPLNVEHLPDKINLGRGSENEAVQLAVDVSAWVNAWPACSISINFLRPYEDIFYTVSGVLDGGLYTYEVTDTDTAIAGTGTLELVCTEDGKLAASAVARFVVEERLLGTQSPTPPEPVQSWYTRALQAADDAEDAADRAETAAESIESINPRVTALEHIVETSEQTAWNQLNANTASTSTASGVTFTNNNDGTWTLTGNGTGAERKLISAVSLTVGHVYAVLNGGIDTTDMNAYVCVTKNGTSLKAFNTENLFAADNDYNQFNLRTLSGFTAPEGGLEFAPMLIDLTAIYGEGNEPSTIAEFRQLYPHRIYPYAAIGSTRNLDITEVHGAQIAELQDDLDDANDAITANATAITALDNAKADKTELNRTNRVVSALVEAGKGKILRFETDDDDAYAKSVPSGGLNATTTEWGGKSVVWNQLVKTPRSSFSLGGLTITNNEDGTFTINGTATENVETYLTDDAMKIPANHKVFYFGCPVGGSVNTYAMGDGNGFGDTGSGYIKTYANATSTRPRFSIKNGFVCNNLVYKPKFVDLTQMGFADITSTDDPRIAAIEAYAAEHPEYNAGEIVSADVVDVVEQGINLVDSDTFFTNYFSKQSDGSYHSFTDVRSDSPTIFNLDRGYYAMRVKIKCPVGKNYRLNFIKPDGTPMLVTLISTGDWIEETFISSDEVVGVNWNYSDRSNDVSFKDLQIVRGTTQMSFKPYHTPVTHPIPSSVLTQYPLRSAGSVYDTISFDGEKWWHTKRIGEVDLGSLNWSYNATQRVFASAKISGIREHSSNDATPNWLCEKYATSSLNGIRADFEGTHDKAMGQGFQSGIGNNSQCIRDDAYTDATAFKNAMDGVMLQYELATPVVTDITALMGTAGTDLIAMAVESGGTITFAQQNGTIFPVPNSVEYTVKISEVE